MTGPGGFQRAIRFQQDVKGLGGVLWKPEGLDGSWWVYVGLGLSRWVSTCHMGSWSVLEGFSGSWWFSVYLAWSQRVLVVFGGFQRVLVADLQIIIAFLVY